MRFFATLFLVITALGNAPAYAGAWTQPSGDTEAILTWDYYQTSSYYDNSGNKKSQPRYQQGIFNPYVEYGLRDDLTLGANLLFESVRQDNAAHSISYRSWGMGDSELFLRKRLWQDDGAVISIEPLVKLPSPAPGDLYPAIGSRYPDAQLGIAAGSGFSKDGLYHFADLDVAYRYRFGTPKDQMRVIGTLGLSVTSHLMIMPQAFMTYRMTSSPVVAFQESPSNDYDLLRLQLSAVYTFNRAISMQVGAFTNEYAKNTGAGGGGLFALWIRF